MDARLAKSGLRPEVRRKIASVCEGCGRETQLVVSSGGYVSGRPKTDNRKTVSSNCSPAARSKRSQPRQALPDEGG
ncbi:MAG TPA: hypothetical protein VFS59_09440, partial [Gemmatimonadaceae bacterium]|nr:hypothetical protein [Gemmatimonadaceae bacterium]